MVEWGSQGMMQCALSSVHQALGSGTGIEDLFSSESGHAAVYIQHVYMHWVLGTRCSMHWVLGIKHWSLGSGTGIEDLVSSQSGHGRRQAAFTAAPKPNQMPYKVYFTLNLLTLSLL